MHKSKAPVRLTMFAVFSVLIAVAPASRAGGPIAVDIFPNLAGIGVGALSDYSGSNDYVGGAAPGVRYTFEGTRRYVDWWGAFGTANLINSPNWQAGPLLSYRFGRKDVKDPVVRLMHEVDNTLEAGGFVSYVHINTQGVPWRARLAVGSLWDLGDVYSGATVIGWASFWLPLSQTVFVGLGGGLTHAGADFMNAYYGVTQADAAASGLPAFNAGKGVKNWYAWPAVIWKLDKSWALGAGLMYQRLAGDAADSPIVKDRGNANQFIGGIGLGYLW